MNGSVVIVDYDPRWPRLYEEESARVREAVRKKYELLKEDPAWAAKNRARWQELAAGLE
jgi:GrpB-like predicted nucleotidyltransferase (UPF0157 family)